MHKVIAKAIVAFLGSGAVTAAVTALPGTGGMIAGFVVAAITGIVTYLVPNAKADESAA